MPIDDGLAVQEGAGYRTVRRMEAQVRHVTRRSNADERMRDAAQRLFLERGFAGTSTDAICAEARVSKETIYSYYGGKEGLLAAVLRHLIETAEIGVPQPSRRRRNLREELIGYASGLVDDLMNPDYLALVRLLISEISRQPQLGGLFRTAVAERAFRGVAGILENRGISDEVDVNAASRLFVGGLLTYVLLDGLLNAEEPRKPSRARIAAHVDLYVQALPKPKESSFA